MPLEDPSIGDQTIRKQTDFRQLETRHRSECIWIGLEILQKCFIDYITGQAILSVLLHEVVGGGVHIGHHGVDHDYEGGGEHAEARQQLQGEPEGGRRARGKGARRARAMRRK